MKRRIAVLVIITAMLFGCISLTVLAEEPAFADFEAAETMTLKPFKLGDKPYIIPTGIKAVFPQNEFLMLVNIVHILPSHPF